MIIVVDKSLSVFVNNIVVVRYVDTTFTNTNQVRKCIFSVVSHQTFNYGITLPLQMHICLCAILPHS